MEKCWKKVKKNACMIYADFIKPQTEKIFRKCGIFVKNIIASEELKPENIQKQATKIKKEAKKAIKIIASDIAEISEVVMPQSKQLEGKAITKKTKK
jgi:hypothetical protein